MGATELLTRGLRDRTRALLAWGAGIAAYAALLAALFPSLEGSEELARLSEDYPAAIRDLFGLSDVDLTTGPGYIDTELFNLMLPLLVLVFAIGSGSRTLAAEEEAGRLELLLSYPVRRRDAALAKAAAVGLEVVIFGLVAFVALAVLDLVFGLDLDRGRLAEAMLGVVLLGVFHGWLALAVGAARPSRGLAIAVPAGLAAFGYLVNGLHGLAGWLDPFRFLSTFWWLGQSPLSKGVQYDGLLVLVVAALVALELGALLIERRDLQVP